MLFRLIYDDDLAQAAYLIGCQKTREAIVIDPERDVDRYIELAAEHGLRIVAAAETHIHADFLSGVRELSERVGAEVMVSGEGGDDWQSSWLEGYPHRVLREGDVFSIGGIEFTVMHTPGHTPEHIIYVLRDLGAGASEPLGVVSGDFVFVGDLGRPDLLETAAGIEDTADTSAHQLASSARRFLALPEFLQVWPAHGAGSACGKALGAVPQSTVGYESRFNPMLGLAGDEDAFVENILSGQPEPPAYFARMKTWNRDGVPLLGQLPEPTELGAEDLASGLDEDVRVVDVRPWAEFRERHLPGSIWSPHGVMFLGAVGSYVEPGERIALVVTPEEQDRFVRNLVRIGLDRVAFVIRPGALASSEAAMSSIGEVSAEEMRGILEREPGRSVLDVRRRAEWDAGHLDGAINIAHTRLVPRLDEVPADGPLLVHCAGGIRSAIAASELQRRGINAINVAGGWAAMRRAGIESSATNPTA
ncbi:MAG: MBL fold metallo-hydrolase [Phycisphaerales bacterium]|nr:MBL fold metallo-hydrolase [Phycisphaerales bacterium]